MGTSNWQQMPFCIDVLMHINPASVLDVGVGFGRWGAITREFCELWQERILPESWKIHIEGIEGFPDQLGPWQKSFYNQIHIGDARQLLGQLPGPWDLIIFGDVLEHFEKQESRDILKRCLDHANYLLINIPIGAGFEQGERYGNPYEAHLSLWEVNDFKLPEARCSRLVLDAYGRTYLSVVLSKTDPRGLSQVFGLRWGLDEEFADVDFARQRLLHDAAALRDYARTEAASHTGAAQTIALLRRRIHWLEGNVAQLEASMAWRTLQFCNRIGLLALPRGCLRLGRRLFGGGRATDQPITAPPPVPPQESSTSPAPTSPAPTSRAPTSPAPTSPQFNVPVPVTSDVFVELLKRRPASFQKIYEAPALMSPQERVLLYGLTFALAPQRYLEIGTCRGGSAVIVSAAMDDLNQGRAFGLDPEPAVAPDTLAGICHRFTLVAGHSPRDIKGLADQAGGKFELLLVDGDHSYEATLADLRGVMPVASPDAVILIHDAYNAQVSRAVDDFVASLDGGVVDGGMLATSCNEMTEANGALKWGGLRLLRLRAGTEQRMTTHA